MGHDIYIVEVDEEQRKHYTANSGSGLSDQSTEHLYWTFNYNPAVLGKTSLIELLHGRTGDEVASVLIRVVTMMLSSGVTMGDCLERYRTSIKTNEWGWTYGRRLTDEQKIEATKRREYLGFTEDDYTKARESDRAKDAEFVQTVALWKIMFEVLPIAREYPNHCWFSDQVWGTTDM